jgi:hypothetical protein
MGELGDVGEVTHWLSTECTGRDTVLQHTQGGKLYHGTHRVRHCTTEHTEWDTVLQHTQGGTLYYCIHRVVHCWLGTGGGVRTESTLRARACAPPRHKI